MFIIIIIGPPGRGWGGVGEGEGGDQDLPTDMFVGATLSAASEHDQRGIGTTLKMITQFQGHKAEWGSKGTSIRARNLFLAPF